MKPRLKLWSDGRVTLINTGTADLPAVVVANWHPEQIKAAIRMKGTTPSAIADELNLSRTTVSQVIHGTGVSSRVAARISQLLGLSEQTIWPNKKATLLRRTKSRAMEGAQA